MPDTRSYEQIRDLDETPEPSGGDADFDWADGRPIFVIQKHDASNLHYDVRLEAAGVLKSWVVPKGPSTDPSDQRFARATEDHPLAYAEFEGVIPEGEYGAGTVLIWDRGAYRNAKGDGDDPPPVTDQIRDGHVSVWLEGQKVSGGYALIRTQEDDDDRDERWLLVKMDDDEADARRKPTSTEPKSVATGHTLDEIRDEEGSDG